MKKNFFAVVFFALSVFLGGNVMAGVNNSSEAKNVSNTKTVIEGKVVDKNTLETLAGVKIMLNGQKVYTDLDGRFTISTFPTGKARLKASLISYEEQDVEIDLSTSNSLQIKLAQH